MDDDNNNNKESERLHVALAWVRIDVSECLGTSGSISTGPVGTLVAVSLASTTVAAESYRVGESRVSVDGAAR